MIFCWLLNSSSSILSSDTNFLFGFYVFLVWGHSDFFTVLSNITCLSTASTAGPNWISLKGFTTFSVLFFNVSKEALLSYMLKSSKSSITSWGFDVESIFSCFSSLMIFILSSLIKSAYLIISWDFYEQVLHGSMTLVHYDWFWVACLRTISLWT